MNTFKAVVTRCSINLSSVCTKVGVAVCVRVQTPDNVKFKLNTPVEKKAVFRAGRVEVINWLVQFKLHRIHLQSLT